MKKYETLIFDLDDTLIDNMESIKYAFKIITKELNIDYNEELLGEGIAFTDIYKQQNRKTCVTLPYVGIIKILKKYI